MEVMEQKLLRKAWKADVMCICQRMDLKWSKFKHEDLRLAFEKELSLSDERYPLSTRFGNIENYVQSDMIWPPISRTSEKLIPSLREVLSRLPEEDFIFVEGRVRFILEDESVIALNVHPPSPDAKGLFDIILFHHVWEFSPKALIGLIAHELAHTFVSGPNYQADEAEADEKAISWGFAEEIDCYRSEKEEFLKKASARCGGQ